MVINRHFAKILDGNYQYMKLTQYLGLVWNKLHHTPTEYSAPSVYSAKLQQDYVSTFDLWKVTNLTLRVKNRTKKLPSWLHAWIILIRTTRPIWHQVGAHALLHFDAYWLCHATEYSAATSSLYCEPQAQLSCYLTSIRKIIQQ